MRRKMPTKWAHRTLPGLLLLALLPAVGVAADVLVMRDGAEVETRGPWRLKGRMVVFTSANGTLSSLRLDEVDLEASEAATARAAAAAEAPAEEAEPAAAPPPKREPVLVITDRDVPRADETSAGPSAGAGLRVVDWELQPREGDPAFELVGTLRNDGTDSLGGITLDATLRSPDGENSMTTVVQVTQGVLGPGEASTFRAAFSRQRVEASGFAEGFAAARVELRPAGNVLFEEPEGFEDRGTGETEPVIDGGEGP